VSPPLADPELQRQLCQNAARLLQAALQQDSARWAAEDAMAAPAAPAAPVAAPGAPALPSLNLADLDLGMLEGLDSLAPADPPDAATLQAALQALPAALPALTQPLSDEGFAQWLALYQQGEPAVVEVVTLAHRLLP
jgi:hypothetical protein